MGTKNFLLRYIEDTEKAARLFASVMDRRKDGCFKTGNSICFPLHKNRSIAVNWLVNDRTIKITLRGDWGGLPQEKGYYKERDPLSKRGKPCLSKTLYT